MPRVRSLLGVALALFLIGCASRPPLPPDMPARQALRDFALEARFALRLERFNGTPESASGRLSWEHAGPLDRVLLANPLGQGIAEISVAGTQAELRTSDGQTRRAADAEQLLHAATGYRLPIARLPAWLLGRGSDSAERAEDARGRPLRLVDDGWRIDYDYADAADDALPSRLTLRRIVADGELELRLRIEEWRPLPGTKP